MPRPPRPPSVLGLCAAALAASAALGLTDEPEAPAHPKPDPNVEPERPRSIVPSPTIVSPDQDRPLAPVRPFQPEQPAAELGMLSIPPLMREGAFIANARGRVVRGKSGRWFVVFDRDAAGHTLPPMILLEHPNLASVVRLAEHAPPGARMRLSGQTTVYRDRNFFLVTLPPALERPADEPAAAPEPAEPAASPDTPATSPAPSDGAEPPIERIIADLDRAVAPRRSAAQPIAPTPPAEPGATAESSDRASGYLVSRRGRLVRTPDGMLQFRTDSGASGLTEPAYTLLPCQNLTALEAWSDTAGDATPLTLSGEVFSYRGRAFLLPSMYTVPRQTDAVLPTQ